MTHRRANPDEIQLRIDPIHADVDEEITGLRSQVRRLRNVAQEIEVEAKSQNAMLNQLDMTVMKAQAWLKNNVRRLNKSTIQSGSNHVVHVVCFALICFFLVYFWSKISR
ncbi:bet1-like protein At4g14600 [Rosa rugosa]|uniref:Putative target SNARE coiled-coil domain-containing protein n=1 Tax=Rosa chinensis TaxID=74649 RepID=A0A2P6PH94_ROSCH|nr:bet1-like protein At4g14600 [Rosa chinensis]XP_062027349.1 bet1-like protein At4g14600 [Rosa rugosa]PRQ21303.1 putative target SNARE coiled-coil domain-containing protein [Rosa chinensis]